MFALAGPITRIALRYGGGYLAGRYGLAIDFNDPDIFEVSVAIVSGLLFIGNEGWYVVAHKRGWQR
jgi:hypothetical protein